MNFLPEVPEKLFGYDVDHLFAYPTAKFVRIRDARLGFFHYLSILIIIVYLFVYDLWYLAGYMEQSGVAGAVRFTLQQPTQDTCNPFKRGCKNDFTDVEDLSYCSESTDTYSDGNKFECQFYDNIGAQQILDKSIMVATRITTYEQELVCNNTKPSKKNCPRVYNTTSKYTEYVVDPEYFTVLIDHQVIASSTNFQLSSSSADISGRLFVENNKKLCKEYKDVATMDPRGEVSWDDGGSCYIKPDQTIYDLDYFQLDLLLRAANTNLDDANYGGETFRETGAIMLLQITYDNYKKWTGGVEPFYYYKPTVVHESSYKYYESVYSDYRKERTLLNKHGIFIEAVQGGVLRRFSFNTLLIELTTSLTLLAIAKLITDFVALKLLPDSTAYAEYKFELTEDFSDRRAVEKASINGEVVVAQNNHKRLSSTENKSSHYSTTGERVNGDVSGGISMADVYKRTPQAELSSVVGDEKVSETESVTLSPFGKESSTRV